MSEDTTPYETAFPPKHESTATYSGEFNRIEGYDVAGDKITFERAPVETAVPESPAPIEDGWRREGEANGLAVWSERIGDGHWRAHTVRVAVEHAIASRAAAAPEHLWRIAHDRAEAAESRITTLERDRERMETALREWARRFGCDGSGQIEKPYRCNEGAFCDGSCPSTVTSRCPGCPSCEARRALTGSQEDGNG